MAGIAREFDVSMASHEDRPAAIRRYYNTLGCSIAEFPLSIDAVQESGRLGNPVILGSPNIVRGGSHLGSLGINAPVTITQGQGYSRALCWTCGLPACADTTNHRTLIQMMRSLISFVTRTVFLRHTWRPNRMGRFDLMSWFGNSLARIARHRATDEFSRRIFGRDPQPTPCLPGCGEAAEICPSRKGIHRALPLPQRYQAVTLGG